MTDTYTDLANRREVYISRFASYLRNEYSTPNLEDAYKQARLILLEAEAILSRKQLNLLTAAVSTAIAESTNASWTRVTNELDELAALESSYYAKMFGDVNSVVLAVPLAADVIDSVTKSKLSLDSGQKGVWAKFTKENTDSVTKMFVEQIKTGYGESESIGQINKRLKAVSSGVLKNQAEALIRTGVSHYAQESRKAMANANKDIIDREIPSVTFDNRISDTCMSLSARYPDGWILNKSPVGYPPYHFRCRTFITFLIKGQKNLTGTKAALEGRKGRKAEGLFEGKKERLRTRSQVRYEGRKDSDIFKAGQIKADKPFSRFLRTQPDWYIKDTLGEKRGQAFIDGKLDLSNLTDESLSPLTLAEIGIKQ